MFTETVLTFAPNDSPLVFPSSFEASWRCLKYSGSLLSHFLLFCLLCRGRSLCSWTNTFVSLPYFFKLYFKSPHPYSVSVPSFHCIKRVLHSSDSSYSTMLLVTPPDSATYTPAGLSDVTSSPSGSLQRTHLLVYTFRTHGSSISLHTETVIVEFTSNLKCFTLLFFSYPSPVCPHFLVAPRAPSQVSHVNISYCTPHQLPICCCGVFWIPSCAVSMVFAH